MEELLAMEFMIGCCPFDTAQGLRRVYVLLIGRLHRQYSGTYGTAVWSAEDALAQRVRSPRCTARGRLDGSREGSGTHRADADGFFPCQTIASPATSLLHKQVKGLFSVAASAAET